MKWELGQSLPTGKGVGVNYMWWLEEAENTMWTRAGKFCAGCMTGSYHYRTGALNLQLYT